MKHNADHNKLKLRIMVIILGLSVAMMLYFAVSLVLEVYRNRQGEAFYASLSVDFIPRPALPTLPPLNNNGNAGLAVGSGGEENTGAELEEPKVFVPFLDFDELRKEFPNIIGWIQSEGTVINYPIVQGADNDFYLTRLPNGTRHQFGSIFLDYRNAADLSDTGSSIYGHNMRGDDMFGSLQRYRNQQYFENHASMFIFTPTANYMLVLFAGYQLDSRFEAPPMGFGGEAEFDRFVADIRRRSVFRSNVEVRYGDRLVFLCTCVYAGTSPQRFIIAGKLVELGEI
jgi:sortase B